MRSGGADPGLGGGAVQFGAQRVRGDAAALVGAQEVGGFAGARLQQRPAEWAVLGDLVDNGESVVVDDRGHGADVLVVPERVRRPPLPILYGAGDVGDLGMERAADSPDRGQERQAAGCRQRSPSSPADWSPPPGFVDGSSWRAVAVTTPVRAGYGHHEASAS
jgi:hypothetical protein